MKRSRFTYEQITGFLRQVEAGVAVNKLGRKCNDEMDTPSQPPR
jgi:hypothetical protein